MTFLFNTDRNNLVSTPFISLKKPGNHAIYKTLFFTLPYRHFIFKP